MPKDDIGARPALGFRSRSSIHNNISVGEEEGFEDLGVSEGGEVGGGGEGRINTWLVIYVQFPSGLPWEREGRGGERKGEDGID